MNTNFVKQVYKWNQERGFLDKGYSDERECAYPIEEALEGFDNSELYRILADAQDCYGGQIPDSNNPKELSRAIIASSLCIPLNTVERLDKHIDIIVYSLGSIFKLGLSPQQATRAIEIVCEANTTKGSDTDSAGKCLKGGEFVSPNKKLEEFIKRERII